MTNVCPKSKTAKDLVREMFKEPRFRRPFDSQHVKKCPKHLWNLHESSFIIFFTTLRENDLENVSLSDTQNLRGVC